MRSIALAGVATAVLTIVLAGCASAGSAPDAPVPGASDAPAAPSAPSTPVVTGADAQARLAELPMPSATEPVLAIGTVLGSDAVPGTDDGAILCVGPVAESAPPQCSGPLLSGWDWDAVDHEVTGGVPWVQGVAVQGTYDAEEQVFIPTGDPTSAAAIQLPAIETPRGSLDEATIAALQEDLATLQRPDVLGSWGETGTVVLSVAYDDGSMQAALDEIYGPGAVFVVPAMR